MLRLIPRCFIVDAQNALRVDKTIINPFIEKT